MRLAFRKQSARCICMNGPDAPSTHRAAVHSSACPHGTLVATTQLFPAIRAALDAKRAKKRAAEQARNQRPVRRVVL